MTRSVLSFEWCQMKASRPNRAIPASLNYMLTIFGLATFVVLSGCTTNTVATGSTANAIRQPSAKTGSNTTGIRSSDGKIVGSVQFRPWPRSVALGIVASSMAPGEYRLWLHEKGSCDKPSFSSSGPNWRPAIGRYGNADLSHVGRINVTADGRVSVTILVNGAKLRPGDEGADLPVLIDADGVSLHFVPEPGTWPLARLACAAIER